MTDPPSEHVARGQSTVCFQIRVSEDKRRKSQVVQRCTNDIIESWIFRHVAQLGPDIFFLEMGPDDFFFEKWAQTILLYILSSKY